MAIDSTTGETWIDNRLTSLGRVWAWVGGRMCVAAPANTTSMVFFWCISPAYENRLQGILLFSELFRPR